MQRTATLLLTLMMAVACGEDRRSKRLSEPGEKLYAIQGKIVGRDASSNTLTVDTAEITGFMEAMTMDYSVRGAEVGTLPANGSRIQAKLHVTDRAFWLTDVKQTS